MPAPGTCDDCGCALGECECSEGEARRPSVQEKLDQNSRERRLRDWPKEVQGVFHLPEPTPDVRKRLMVELAKVRSNQRAILVDAQVTRSTKVTRDMAHAHLVEAFHTEWARLIRWERIHWARDILRVAGYGDTQPTQLRLRQESVAKLHALVYLMRLARADADLGLVEM